MRATRTPALRKFALLLIPVTLVILSAPAFAAQQSQDWALRACKNEVGARIADLPLSEITVETSTADGEGNSVINWRTTRGSSGFCRVSRQGNILQFKVEEMARAAGTGQPDSEESGYIAACRTEAASRLAIRESDIFVHVSTRDAEQTELDWRTRRGARGECRVDRRGRITAFEVNRRNDGDSGGNSGGSGGTAPSEIPYAQRTAYDSGYSWGEDDRGRSRARSYQRHSDLYTADTEAMFGKGYDDGFDRRAKDYRLPASSTGTGAGSGTGTGTGQATPAAVVQPGRYTIEFVASGKMLDLRREDGSTVQQWSGSFLAKKNQVWDIEDTRNGYFYIRSAENGKALTAGGTANGSAVDAQNLGNRREQMWRIKVLEGGEVTIVSRLGPALDLPNGKGDNGLKPQLWQPNDKENQRFRLKPAS